MSKTHYTLREKKNPLKVHGEFDSDWSAQQHLTQTVPMYIKRGYFTDKTLAAGDFYIHPPEGAPMGWVIDADGNRASIEHFGSVENALEALNSLDTCQNCINCEGCVSCRDCLDCTNCTGCNGCFVCGDCEDCDGCRECFQCDDCDKCVDCVLCFSCRRAVGKRMSTGIKLGDE